MKLSEGIKQKGLRMEIPDASRDDLPEFFAELGYKVGAEIGVFRGEFTEKLCKAGLKMFGIDPYIDYPDFRNPQHRNERHLEIATQVLEPYDYTLIRKMSMDALGDFPDESLDFVYIDGNHHLRYVVEDIVEWTKKVKKGGIIAGHDFVYLFSEHPMKVSHVIYAVEAYTQAYNIKNWHIIGRKETKEGEKRDKWRSWMFVKP
jgi:hypothetical protein